MRGDLLALGAMAALAAAGSTRGARNRRGSPSRYMFTVLEETQAPWEEDADSPDSTFDRSLPREASLANDDDLYEHLGLNVDLLPREAKGRIPAWIRAAVGFYKMVYYDNFSQPEYEAEAPEYFEWSDWEMKDFASGETHKKSIHFAEGDVRMLLSGRSIDVSTPWPVEAKRLVLAIFSVNKIEKQRASHRFFPRADIRAIQYNLSTQRELIRNLLREALGVPRLELDFGEP